MKIRYIILIMFIVPFFNFGQAQIISKNWSESLISEDHTGEGFLITLPNGTIEHYFRLDTGLYGNHKSNNAYIALRKSYDNGNTWESSELVLNNDILDDRNIHGGISRDNEVILFYRWSNYPWESHNVCDDCGIETIQNNYVYTDSTNENNFSEVEVFGNIGNASRIPATSQLVTMFDTTLYLLSMTRGPSTEIIGDDTLILSFCGVSITNDVTNWNYDSIKVVHHVDSVTSEAAFAYIGDGRLIGLIRNDRYYGGTSYRYDRRSYFQVTSTDYGKTWSTLKQTNIANGGYCVSPSLLYDEEIDKLWIFATNRTDRRLWTYCVNPDSIFDNPLYYYQIEPVMVYDRSYIINPDTAKTNARFFYGYPTYTRLKNGEIFVVFADAYWDIYEDYGDSIMSSENADLFQFYISSSKYKLGELSKDNSEHAYDTAYLSKIDSVFIIRDTYEYSITAGKEITLSPGFYAEEGSIFSAKIKKDSSYNEFVVYRPSYSEQVNQISETNNSAVEIDSDIEKIIDSQTLKVYPNPAIERVVLEFSNKSSGVSDILIFNTSGQLVLVKRVDLQGNNTIELDIKNFNSGNYIIKIFNASDVYTKKLIIR